MPPEFWSWNFGASAAKIELVWVRFSIDHFFWGIQDMLISPWHRARSKLLILGRNLECLVFCQYKVRSRAQIWEKSPKISRGYYYLTSSTATVNQHITEYQWILQWVTFNSEKSHSSYISQVLCIWRFAASAPFSLGRLLNLMATIPKPFYQCWWQHCYGTQSSTRREKQIMRNKENQ